MGVSLLPPLGGRGCSLFWRGLSPPPLGYPPRGGASAPKSRPIPGWQAVSTTLAPVPGWQGVPRGDWWGFVSLLPPYGGGGPFPPSPPGSCPGSLVWDCEAARLGWTLPPSLSTSRHGSSPILYSPGPLSQPRRGGESPLKRTLSPLRGRGGTLEYTMVVGVTEAKKRQGSPWETLSRVSLAG
jgi:hypothetical protein